MIDDENAHAFAFIEQSFDALFLLGGEGESCRLPATSLFASSRPSSAQLRIPGPSSSTSFFAKPGISLDASFFVVQDDQPSKPSAAIAIEFDVNRELQVIRMQKTPTIEHA